MTIPAGRLGRGGNYLQNAQSMAQGAQSAMGNMTKENQTTEYSAAPMTGKDYLMGGLQLYSTGKQVIDLGGKAWDGMQWVAGKLGAPNAASQAVNANAGGQAVKDVSNGIMEGVQMNSGAAVSPEELQNFFYQNPVDTAAQTATQGVTDAAAMGENAANVATQGAGGAAATGESAAATAESATAAAEGGLSTMGAVVGPAVGGVAGGLAGRELGRAIGGDTGADIGSVVGSMGGAYLGGLGASALSGALTGSAVAGAGSAAAGAAGGAAAGATMGSAIPGFGTAIGAGIGALVSFFL